MSRPASRVNGSTTSTVENAVEESAFERDQEQVPACAIRSHEAEVAAVGKGVITDGVLESVQVVEDVWRTQELQQAKARVSGQVDERERVPAKRQFR